MLKYKLCKQLREAGFPQEKYRKVGSQSYEGIVDGEMRRDAYYIPILEELIKECGYGFDSFRQGLKNEPDWVITGFNKDKQEYITETGNTFDKALEGMAKLYIKLQEND